MKYPRMPRCRQFSDDRQEPSAERSLSATRKLGDTARAENWCNPGGKKGSHPFLGRERFGAFLGVAPQLQPLGGMLLRCFTDICPKELTRDMRGYFNSLLDVVAVL